MSKDLNVLDYYFAKKQYSEIYQFSYVGVKLHQIFLIYPTGKFRASAVHQSPPTGLDAQLHFTLCLLYDWKIRWCLYTSDTSWYLNIVIKLENMHNRLEYEI